MDHELIERLAREAGAEFELVGEEANSKCGYFFRTTDMAGDVSPSLCRFAALLAEECAKVCDAEAECWTGYEKGVAQECAAAVRAKCKEQ